MPSHHTPLHLAAAKAVAVGAALTPSPDGSVTRGSAGIAEGDVKVDAAPRPELGDLAVGCFAIAKAQGKNPAQVAQQIAASFTPNELLASATAAGPFVNFRANRAATYRWLVGATLNGALLPRAHGAGKTICIDYGSPNISKHLAYHHIRGTTIGHSLAQSYRALGYKVIGINFLGDWGNTHGQVLAAYHELDGAAQPLSVELLNTLYVKFTKTRPKDDARAAGREWLKKLESGDAEATALWKRFREVSWAEFEEIYKILDIEYDDLNGESFFWRDGERIVDELRTRGILTESNDAEVVELEGEKNPIILRTKDGTTLYATRDVAAATYRWEHYKPDRSLYVVDRGQADHFRMLFKLLAKMGLEWASRLQHVPYGLVRVGGKKGATRLGNVLLMQQVFAIAEDEVRRKIAEVNPELPADVVDKVAREVGIGAVIFANLAQQREKDIDFDIDKAVSLEGDSGPYLQMQHARCSSVFRKAGEQVTSADADFTKLAHDAEWAIARRLLDFPEIVVRAGDACEPHLICHYLLDLAADFSRWWTLGNGDASLRVLVEDRDVRRARLSLVAAVQATLREGLSLLGIAAPEQM
jgi:arginyl-tRNA synthetase